jgi:hypothetical protein
MSLAGNLITNFKSMLFKIFTSSESALKLVAGSENIKEVAQDPKSWGYAIALLTSSVSGLLLIDMLKKLAKGHSIDDQLEEIKKDPFHFVANSIGRSDVLGFLGDFIVKASKPADIASALVTPAINTLLLPGNIAYNVLKGTINEGHPINKASTASAVELADQFVPFTNLLWMGPMTEEYIKKKKELAKNLAR